MYNRCVIHLSNSGNDVMPSATICVGDVDKIAFEHNGGRSSSQYRREMLTREPFRVVAECNTH